MASSAVGAVPCPALPGPSSGRLLHCEKTALKCDECLAVLALCLATELGFDQREVLEMSPAWYLAQLRGDLSQLEQAAILRQLTAGLCSGLEVMAAAEEIPVTDKPAQTPAPRQFNPLFWVAVCTAVWLFATAVIAVVTITLRS